MISYQSVLFIATAMNDIYIYIYYIKLKSRPSVRPSVRISLVEWIFAVDARIHVKLARNEAAVFWEHEVCFYNVLTPAVRHLRRFECQGVDDSCQNFTYIPANRSPDTIDNIYILHLFSVKLVVQCAASDSRLTDAGLNPR